MVRRGLSARLSHAVLTAVPFTWFFMASYSARAAPTPTATCVPVFSTVSPILSGGPVAVGCRSLVMDNLSVTLWGYDPSSFNPVGNLSCTAPDLKGFSAPLSNEKWAGGAGGYLLKYDGASWSDARPLLSTSASFIHSISVLPPGGVLPGQPDGWLTDQTGGFAYSRGTSLWTRDPGLNGGDWFAVKAGASNHVWAGGLYGILAYYNGSAWTGFGSVTGAGNPNFDAIDVLSDGNGWAVGDNGLIFRLSVNGSNTPSYARVTSPTIRSLLDVRILSATEAWAVGSNGTVLRWNGTNWSVFANTPAFPGTVNFNTLDFYGPSSGWLLGSNGSFYQWNGSSWVPSMESLAPNPGGVGCSSIVSAGPQRLELPKPGPTSTPTPTFTPTVTPTPSLPFTPAPTDTPANTFTPTITFTPTPTPTPGYIGPNPPTPGTSFVYPLPATGGIVNIVYDMKESGTARVLVWSESAELVTDVSQSHWDGPQKTTLDVGRWARGIYFYRVLLHYDSGKKERLSPGKFIIGWW